MPQNDEMKRVIAVCLFSILIPPIAQAQQIDLSRAYKYQNSGELKKAYEIFADACKKDSTEACAHLHGIAGVLGLSAAKQAVDILVEACKHNAQQCEFLGMAYENSQDYTKAIAAYKKKFQVAARESRYPVTEYEHGSKELAYEAARIACKEVPRDCKFYRERFPENPYNHGLMEPEAPAP